MSTNFSVNGTNVPTHLKRMHANGANATKRPSDEIDIMIASLTHIIKISPDPDIAEYYRGALTALLWVRHPLSYIEAGQMAKELIRGYRNV
ncbi:MAG: hypothetical protein KDJ52_01750 [Anaerolineae bacterium]|nr:hypothetical protein [Anaerolineae bacterium]